MRILEIYQNYSVPFVTEGNKHARDGWVNTHCPFCSGEQDYHLGYNLETNHFHCWRCGGHFQDKTLEKLLNVSNKQARQIIREYGGISRKAPKESKVKVNLHPFKHPTGEMMLRAHHRRYLMDRKFDPDMLEEVWGITGTGPVAFLDKINYSHRILAPIFWNGKEVSFQTRHLKDIKAYKYMACPMAREEICHQHILYGKQEKWGRRGIGVEGITDVWRLGEGAFGVFGIDYTLYQVREIKRHFDEVILLFDPEESAIRQADKLIAELQFRGVKAWRENIKTDPGSMDQKEANYLMKQLLK